MLFVARGDGDPEVATAPSVTTTIATGETVATDEPVATTTPARDVAETIALIQDFVAAERGLPFLEDVDVVFLDDSAFRLRLEEEEETEEDRQEIREAERIWRALGLIGPDVDLEAVVDQTFAEGVLGFFDSETDELVMRGIELTPYVRATLAHELTHALDDQHFNLHRPELDDALDESSTGFSALVEGSALVVQNAYVSSFSREERTEYFSEEASFGAQADLGDIPESVLSVIAFPYIFGEQLVDSLHERDGRDGLDAAFLAPPTTSEQVIEPALYAAAEDRIEVEPPSSDGSETFDEGVFGSFGLLLLLLDHVDGSLAFAAAADGWGGDWYVAWDEADRTCVRIAMIGDQLADTVELQTAFEQWANAAIRRFCGGRRQRRSADRHRLRLEPPISRGTHHRIPGPISSGSCSRVSPPVGIPVVRPSRCFSRHPPPDSGGTCLEFT